MRFIIEKLTAGCKLSVNNSLLCLKVLNQMGTYGIILSRQGYMPRSSVRRSELPASDVTRGCAEIGADVSDERSTMAWSCIYTNAGRLRTNRILHWLAASVIFCCLQPSGFFRRNPREKEKEKCCAAVPILRQHSDPSQCRRHLLE